MAWRGSGDDRRENAFRCWDHTDCFSLTNRLTRNDLFSRETRRDRKKERKKISHELLETLSRDDHLSSRRRAHHSHPIDISFHVDYNEISRIIERRNWMLIFFSFRRNFNCNSGRISLSLSLSLSGQVKFLNSWWYFSRPFVRVEVVADSSHLTLSTAGEYLDGKADQEIPPANIWIRFCWVGLGFKKRITIVRNDVSAAFTTTLISFVNCFLSLSLAPAAALGAHQIPVHPERSLCPVAWMDRSGSPRRCRLHRIRRRSSAGKNTNRFIVAVVVVVSPFWLLLLLLFVFLFFFQFRVDLDWFSFEENQIEKYKKKKRNDRMWQQRKCSVVSYLSRSPYHAQALLASHYLIDYRLLNR